MVKKKNIPFSQHFQTSKTYFLKSPNDLQLAVVVLVNKHHSASGKHNLLVIMSGSPINIFIGD